MKLLGVEEDCEVKVDVLTLINIIVNFPMDLTTRMALRGEFVALGITELLVGLDMIDAPALNQQLAIFRDEQSHDQLDESAIKVLGLLLKELLLLPWLDETLLQVSRGDPLELVQQLNAKWRNTPAAVTQLSRLLKVWHLRTLRFNNMRVSFFSRDVSHSYVYVCACRSCWRLQMLMRCLPRVDMCPNYRRLDGSPKCWLWLLRRHRCRVSVDQTTATTAMATMAQVQWRPLAMQQR